MRNFEQWSQVEDSAAMLKQLQSLMGAYCQLYLNIPMEDARQMLPTTHTDQNNLMSLMMTLAQEAVETMDKAVDEVFAEVRKEKNA